MKLDIQKEKQRLAQTKFIEWVMKPIRTSEMVTVYLSDHKDNHDIGIYCCLISNNDIDRSLNDWNAPLQLGKMC